MYELSEEQEERVQRAYEDYDLIAALQTTEELHAFAKQWNWDDDADPLFLIIRNPECDKGTVLHLYWLTDPVYFFSKYSDEQEAREGDEYELGYFLLLSEIQERYLSGFYTKETIAVEPEKIQVGGLTSERLKRDIPDLMRQPSGGKPFGKGNQEE